MRYSVSYYFFLFFIFYSCFTTKKKTLESTSYTYSTIQKESIHSGSSKEKMTLFLITNKEDSILLRTKSAPVDLHTDKKTTELLAKRLLATVTDPENAGVGIAAPQVGILKKMIVVQRYDKKNTPYETYVNPTIKKYSILTQFCLEGCLSIPNRMDTTKNRAYAILLEYDKLDGSHHIEMVEAFTAVVFQHEIDHLNGILYTDHLDLEIKEAEERMKKLKN